MNLNIFENSNNLIIEIKDENKKIALFLVPVYHNFYSLNLLSQIPSGCSSPQVAEAWILEPFAKLKYLGARTPSSVTFCVWPVAMPVRPAKSSNNCIFVLSSISGKIFIFFEKEYSGTAETFSFGPIFLFLVRLPLEVLFGWGERGGLRSATAATPKTAEPHPTAENYAHYTQKAYQRNQIMI